MTQHLQMRSSRVGFLEGLNPLGLLEDAHQLTIQEFLRDFYTRRGLYDKLKDINALVITYANNLPALYGALDSKYGTDFVHNPPPVTCVEVSQGTYVLPTTAPVAVSPSTPLNKSKMPVNKIILLGNSGVGKTNLLSRLNKGEFNEEFTSTIGVEFLTHVMKIDGHDVKAQIWDTAGQERFHAMMSTYYRKAVGALLIFDVTDRLSLLGVEKWLDQLLNVAEPGLHAVLVGNKCDIPAPKRVVTTEEAQQFAASHHMSYIETSAKTGMKVEEAFHLLISAIYRAHVAEHGYDALPVQNTPNVTIELNCAQNSVNNVDSFNSCA